MPKESKEAHPLSIVRKIISERFPLNQQELADLVDCSRIYIQRIETTKSPLSIPIAQRIDAALGTCFVEHVETKAPDCEYHVDREQILSAFIERQFPEIDEFQYKNGICRIPWGIIFDRYSNGEEENFHVFSNKASKLILPILDKLFDGVEGVVDQLPVKDEAKAKIVSSILDSISSGHPYFQASQEVWEQSMEDDLSHETAWEHRKWIHKMNAQNGLSVNVKRFYRSDESNHIKYMYQTGRKPICDDDEFVREASKGYVPRSAKIKQARAKREGPLIEPAKRRLYDLLEEYPVDPRTLKKAAEASGIEITYMGAKSGPYISESDFERIKVDGLPPKSKGQ